MVTALACVALLSSCSLLPGLPGLHGSGPDYSGQVADVQMRHIADAVNDHDVAALKKVFSQRAREKATNLDSGLAYFLSIFPAGLTTRKFSTVPGESGDDENGNRIVELYADYKVSANGKEYDIYFTEITVDEKNAANIGMYSLGAVAHADSGNFTASGKPTPFAAWKATFAPGIYVPKK